VSSERDGLRPNRVMFLAVWHAGRERSRGEDR
jgi:hypothetical protein